MEELGEVWLPDSMLVEILSRLPSKTLAWERLCDLVSGGDFKSVCYISVDQDYTKVEKGVLNFLPENVDILSSSNGLICCRSSLPCLKPVLYVCNPLNRECITLQWPNIPEISRTVLIFEPFKSQIDVSTDFQVVTICLRFLELEEVRDLNEDTLQFSFHIYSSRTKAWTKSREIRTCQQNLQQERCAIVEGVIFWPTNGQGILMFNPENERSFFVRKPFPAPDITHTSGTCVGEAEGRLQFVRISEGDDGLQVYELEDWFSSRWSQKHFISLEEIVKENPCMGSPWISPLSFKDTTLFLRVSTDIYAFNFDTKKAKSLHSAAYGPKDLYEQIAIPYTMSLVLLA
nr:F-box protein At5g49610-like [Ipomoea batatas]